MYADLSRPPLRERALARALGRDGWRVEVVQRCPSTNAVVAERARQGDPPGLVVVAEHQTAGRGRLDRSWESPPRAGLTFSLLLRPGGEPAGWPWLPLHAAVGVAEALRELAEVDAVLKWPNDVLVDGRKTAGLLAEVVAPDAVVVGIGLNVTTRREELPHEGATSLALAGAALLDRDTLLRGLLRRVHAATAAADADAYRALCSTIGRQVRVSLPDGSARQGTATAVDADGRLVVDGAAYGAGDVVHVR